MGIGKFIFAAGTTAAVGAAASYAGAVKLFKSVIPRQREVRVDIKEMADEAKWEEYKKIIHSSKEWLLDQPLESISIKAGDGITLKGHYLACNEPGKRVVLCLHGYTSNGLGNFCAMAKYYLDKNFDLLIVDLRAHGESGGDYVGFGILDKFDTLNWIEYITNHFGNNTDILLYGVSMGATTSLMTLGFRNLPKAVKGVVADCAFTSPYDVFAHILKRDYHLKPFPVMNICDELTYKKAGYRFKDYSTLTALKETDRPVLLIHGSDDKFVPVWMTEGNFEVCSSPVTKLFVDGAGHGASYYENKELYESALTEFISKYF